MSESHDNDLRLLFAQGAPVPADEGFVAAVTQRVTARRRQLLWQRWTLRGVAVLAVAGLAMILAPYAPVSANSPTTALLQLPESAASIATLARWPPFSYLYLSLAAGLLPLAGTAAWLLRRR